MNNTKRPRVVYDTTAKSLATLYYWRLNGASVTREQFEDVIKNNMFKAKGTKIRKRIESLVSHGIIHFIDDMVYLTDKGFQQVEKNARAVEAIMYGQILRSGGISRIGIMRTYKTLAYRITHVQPIIDRTGLILLRLKRDGGIDYTKDKVWNVRKVEIIRREEKRNGGSNRLAS